MKTTKAQRLAEKLSEQDAKIIHDLQFLANELQKSNENIAGLANALLKANDEAKELRSIIDSMGADAANVRAAAVTVVPAVLWWQKLLPRWGRLRVGVPS